ncbi:MAG: PBP1A family penicillin-binding protein [Parcubacteria group bacterium]|jgi:1A family penicillin-binding protein
MRGNIFFIIKETFWGVAYAIGMIGAGILIASFFIYIYQTPSAGQLTKRNAAQTTIIYDRTGEHILYQIYGEYNRKILSHDQIPDNIRIATVAAEDKSFYSHLGVDFFAIARAFEVNLKNKDIMQGGSTITQQLARNVFLTREKTLLRKYLETIMAFKIERKYSKDEILDFYLNEVPYGSNSYGIESASETFFKKEAKDLTLDEAALLAALPKAPTHYSPYNIHKDELIERQKSILRKMYKLGLVSESETKKALAENTAQKIVSFSQPIEAPHFVFYVIDELEQKYKEEFLETGGLKVYTTLDYDMQKQAEKAVADGAERNRIKNASNVALVAIDPKTGEILSMVGSKNYFDDSIDGQVNVSIMPRQPGSSFKPIIYSAAFEKGYQPETSIVDAPTNFGPDGSGRNYIPKNYDGKFHGTLTMRKALGMSLNIPAVKTLAMIGLPSGIEMAKRLGITTLDDKINYGLAFAIGGAEVKLLDLTSVFSVFANDGKRNPPQAILEVDEETDKYVPERKETNVIDPEIARKINSILTDNVSRSPTFGPRSPIFIPDRIVAAKTGTAQEFRDVWTIGYTPSIAVGVWAGNNDHSPMAEGADGIFTAAPIWRDFMDKTLGRYPDEAFLPYQQTIKGKTELALATENVKPNKKEDQHKKKKH